MFFFVEILVGVFGSEISVEGFFFFFGGGILVSVFLQLFLIGFFVIIYL